MPDTAPDADVNRALRAFVDDRIGSGWMAADRSRRVGRQSLVWYVRASDGRGYYVKQHEARKLFDATVAAYRTWIPAMGEEDWFEIPALVAASDRLGAVVMAEIPGEIVADGHLSNDDRLIAYELGGRFAARFHALPLRGDERGTWADHWHERVAKWLPLAEGFVDAETLAWTYGFAKIRPSEPVPPLVPTHADCSPRNWILHPGAEPRRLGVIDWERARPSMWIEDVWRMAYDYWHHEPAYREAWFRGYGRGPDASEQRWIQRFALVHAVAGLPWATERDDLDYVETNRTIIARVRAEIG